MARLAKKLKKDDRVVRMKVLNPSNKSGGKTWDNMPTLKRLLKTKKMFI